MTETSATNWPVGKVGVVALVGRPNVGKSTLVNQILDYHLVAVSALPQTTRRHWRGIYSDADSQIILVDTPGAHLGKTKLNHGMMEAVMRAMRDADQVLLICDPTRTPGEEDDLVAQRVKEVAKPVLLLMNKADIVSPEQMAEAHDFFTRRLHPKTTTVTLSAITGQGVPELLTTLKSRLPRGPFFYPADQLTDAVEREIAAELIREIALGMFREEVPHALAVQVDAWEEGAKHVLVRATIYVERPGQRAIILGHGGEKIGELRANAEKLLRATFERKMKLNLYIKVATDWRNRAGFLKELGLTE